MSKQNPTIHPSQGMLAYLVGRTRPELAERIASEGRIETAVIGLGRQGARHAGLMREYGTAVTAGVAPGKGGTRTQETIPVYDSVADMLSVHPGIAAVSVWKHYTTAGDATVSAIEAGIPIVVLISEGIPVRDVQRVLVAARRRGTLLLGPNTPGVIFPPERVKIGMLPDIFYPAEPKPGVFSADGVTICSRSGAILYHMSDALAAAGIAQNAVIGVGGDSAVGSPFPTVVPLAMGFDKTELVVVAGEIGGCQEELLARQMQEHPERFPKPVVALISGRCAPTGKTMGHAGAIVAPGSEYGTFATKKAALGAAGVTVVNSQPALVEAVHKALARKTYFLPQRYFERMQAIWDAPPPVPTWSTSVTRIAPNQIDIRDQNLCDLIGARSLIEVTALLVGGALPDKGTGERLAEIACSAATAPVAPLSFEAKEDVSKQLAALLLADRPLASYAGPDVDCAAHALGRVAACFAHAFGLELDTSQGFGALACQAVCGKAARSPPHARMLEACMVASVDHGVTPPSAQATVLCASVRASFEVALATGISNITDVHGGAGAKAAEFFAACAKRRTQAGGSLRQASEQEIEARVAAGAKIEGLGHRVHTQDPRRDALWRLAEEAHLAGPCVEASKQVEAAFAAVRGMSLPVNVDGVIGAIVADMGLDARVAKALFIFGRVAGLAAHYFEEVDTQVPMRRIDFAQAVYKSAKASGSRSAR